MNEVVVLEVALFCCAISEPHPPVPVLNTILPFALVAATIGPMHLSVAMALIIREFTLVDVAADPFEDAAPLSHVISVLALISVGSELSLLTVPFTLAVLLPIYELTDVKTTILVLEFTFTIRHALAIFSCVGFSVKVCSGSGPLF